MYYLTFIDAYSGIYQSQVIDVITHINKIQDEKIKLVAFIPPQNFLANKNKIKKAYKFSIVLPIYAGVSRWRLCEPLLYFLNKKQTIICRGPLATKLALSTFKNVIYDGRAAVKAEVKEYDVVCGNKKLGQDFMEAEEDSVLKTNYRIAVSQKLVTYWKNEYGYSLTDHIVIPCTLSSKSHITLTKNKNDHITVVYAGGIGPWQSFETVVNLFRAALKEYSNIQVLFLTKENILIKKLSEEYPDRCERRWVNHNLVANELAHCDYGILIRDYNITNQVASPVKFAEYLNAGLKVLISENIGDFTLFTKEHDCGIVINKFIPTLNQVSIQEKTRIKELSSSFFDKDSPLINTAYKTLLAQINNETKG